MPGKVMEGGVVAQAIRSKVKEQVRVLKSSRVEPNLATILVGGNSASKAYLSSQRSACVDVGIRSRDLQLASDASQKQLEQVIRELNDDRSVTGILLQLPLPKGLDDVAAVSSVRLDKDVDGLNPCNLGLLTQKGAKVVPCTPKGVLLLLKHYGVKMAGAHAVVINRSKLLGRPLAQLLLNEDATVTVCHSKTRGLPEISKQADILLTGIGRRSEFTVGPNMIKPGAVVVDIGISSVDGKLMGDVDFDSVLQIASLVTPVPGGVGPMTTAMLLYNTLLTACLQGGLELPSDPDELGSPETV